VPELPDVEHERRYLARHATGRTVVEVIVTDAGVLRETTPLDLDRSLRGHRFDEADRHGKWLVAWTTGPAVLFHFGMTGTLRWAEGPDGRHRHDRVIFGTDGGEIRYRNMRKLGGVWLAHDRQEVDRILGSLGPDALELPLATFRERLAPRRGRIKALLMDQTMIAGVGNLMADEILWRARLHPARRVEDLSPEEIRHLHGVLRRVLRGAVDRFDRLPRGWLLPARSPGGPCPRCGTPLSRMAVGGRTTVFCSQCQPDGGS
jgi:formamidopyrimidine-DNA glycosylase